MTAITGTTIVTAAISTSDTLDEYETHRDEFGQGGFRSVADYAARNAITPQRRTEGMWVHVLDNGSGVDEIWELKGGVDDTDWTEVVFSSGGGVDEFTQLTDTPNNYSGQDGKFVTVDETGNALVFTEASGGVEVWTPTEESQPAILEFLLSDNALLTPVANGVLLTHDNLEGNPAAAGTSESFTLSSTETGFYAFLTDTSPQTFEFGYLTLSDNNTDWFSRVGVSISVYWQWNSGTSVYDISIAFQDGKTFEYSQVFTHPDILDREICVSAFLVDNDITCNVYINDGANTSVSSPTLTFIQTLQTAETAIMQAGLVRSVCTHIQSTTTTNQRTIPTLQYDAVELYSTDGFVDPDSYPSNRTDKLFVVTGLASPLLSVAGEIDNGYAVGFDDVGDLITRTTTSADTTFDTSLDYNQDGVWSFLNTVRFDAAVEDLVPIFSNSADLTVLKNHTKYALTFAGQGSSLITLTLPDVTPETHLLKPYVHIETSGKNKSADIQTPDGSNFYIDGVDSNSDIYNMSTRQIVRFIRTSFEGGSQSVWQPLVIIGEDSGEFDNTSLAAYTAAAGINLSTTGANNFEVTGSQNIILTSPLNDISLLAPVGNILLSADPTAALGAATKQYVDASGGLADDSLENFVAAGDISLTTALNSNLTLFSQGTGATQITSGTNGTHLSSLGIISITSGGYTWITSNSFINATADTEITLEVTAGQSLNIGLTEIVVSSDPISDLGVATKGYVDISIQGQFEEYGSSFPIAGMGSGDVTALNSTDVAVVDNTLAFLRLYRFDIVTKTWSQVGNSLAIPTLSSGKVTALSSTEIALWNSTGTTLQTYIWTDPDWVSTGNALVIAGGAIFSDITALNSTDIALINFDDVLQTYRFDGVDWATFGNSLAVDITVCPLAALDSTHIALLNYQQTGLQVYEFVDPNWIPLGTPLDVSGMTNPSIASLSSTDIAIADASNNSILRFHWDGDVFNQVGRDFFPATTQTFPAIAGMTDTDLAFIGSSQDSLITLRFEFDSGFDGNSLQDYTANYGISLTAADDLDIELVTSGTAGSVFLNSDHALVKSDPTDDLGIATKQYVDFNSYNVQTGTTYTVTTNDAGKIIELTNAANITLTVNSGLGDNFTFGVEQGGAGVIIWSGGTATVNNVDGHTQTRGQYSQAVFTSKTDGTFTVSGATE